MKRNWEYKKLGDVCTIVGRIGFRGYKRSDYVEGLHDGAISLSPSNINNGVLDYSKCTFISWKKYKESPEIMIENGDVLLVKTASVGKSAYVEHLPHETTINPQFVVLKHISANHKYIAYVVKSNSFLLDLKSITFGSSVPTLSQKDLADLSIPVPPLEEQSRIVAELDLLTGIIDKQNAQLKELDNLAQAIFYDMFGDPIENPKGWEVKILGDVCSVVNGLVNPNEEPYCNYPHIGGANIQSNTGEFVDVKLAKDEGLISGKYLFDESMILYSKIRPNLNKVALPSFKGICSADMYPLITDTNVASKYYIKFSLTHKKFIEYAVSHSGRANIPKINREALLSYVLPLPPLALQQSFADKIQSIENQKAKIKASIVETLKLLDYTMDKYFG